MYEAFFGLQESPFSLTPDPRFLWLSETHQEGLAALVYGITRHKGFLLLTGEVGTDKGDVLLPLDPHVSKQHARVKIENLKLYLEDLPAMFARRASVVRGQCPCPLRAAMAG